MNPNYIFLVFTVLLLLTFGGCMIAGNVYLSKIAFSTSSMNCDSFSNVISPITTQSTTQALVPTTIQKSNPVITTAHAQGLAIAQVPTQVPAQVSNVCINLDNVQIGFAQFSIVMFWMEFIVLLVGCTIMVITESDFSNMFKITFLSIPLILSIFILVGGVFLTQFAFNATKKTCNNTSNYCYNLNTTQLGFARLTSIFCYPLTIILIGTILSFMYIYI